MDRLSDRTFRRMAEAIISLEKDPRPTGCKKLRNVEEYRIRVGAYRVLYTIDDSQRLVQIMAAGHRRDVYRNL